MTSPRKKEEQKVVKTKASGLHIATNTGPFISAHHACRYINAPVPKKACTVQKWRE
jgi:ribosomal protein L32